MGCDWVLAGRFPNRPYVRRVGGRFRWCTWYCPAPPRALTLDPLSISPCEGKGERFAGEGMIVVVEGDAAVRGWWSFGWLPLCPRFPLTLALSHEGTFAQLLSFPRRRESRGRCKRELDSETVS